MSVSAILLVYLCNPLYREISEGIHDLSHLVETVYDFQSSLAHQDVKHSHSYHDHRRQQAVHEHTTIAVLYRLFEASDERDHNEERTPFELKIDKHLATETYYMPSDNVSSVQLKFDVPENRLSPGHMIKLLQPPRSL